MKNHSLPAPFFRRLLALIYDIFLASSVMYIAGLLIIPIAPEAIENSHLNQTLSLVYQTYLQIIWVGYHFIFWLFGKTPGMKICHLKITHQSPQQALSFWQLALRLVLAILGVLTLIGWLWQLFDGEKRTLYDKWSQSKMVFYPPQPKNHQNPED